MASPDAMELIRRLQDDDPVALEDAYALHAARCNAIAYRVLADDDRARDAVQEAFLALWRHRHGLVMRTAGIGPWLSVVVRNAAIAMLRSAGARAHREERVQAPDASATAPDPADLVVSGIGADAIRAALAALPVEQRTVITLAYFKFMTMAQIAQRTETPLGTVKRRAQLALRQLGRIMSEQRS
jgi:RNA polymerase sigma-70 factor, ECF subfamily